MELKYAVVLLSVLCVIVIVVEELFQSSSFLSRWNSPKGPLVPSKPWDESLKFLSTAERVQQRKRGSWVEEDDVDHDVKDEEDDVDHDAKDEEDYNVWTSRSHEEVQSTEESDRIQKNGRDHKRQNPNKKNYEKLWKNDGRFLDEEEKLRKSPYIYNPDQEMQRLGTSVKQTDVKYLSFFLPWEQKDNERIFSNCHYKKCAFTSDMSQADLVAFKARNIRDHDVHTFNRPLGQRWLMYTIDPAIKSYGLQRNDVKSLFNATMTYNLDSDIPQLFGRLHRVVDDTPREYYDAVFDVKTKMTAWFVSHCSTPSKREEYVERMQRVIDVDVFGECGNFSCGGGPRGPTSRTDDAAVCLPLLTKTYKFYLAFENAFCLDYITEKFFKLFQNVHVIPVVRGGFQYKKYLPSGIFIDADDFKSPEELSQYLIELGNDKERYTEILRRKSDQLQNLSIKETGQINASG